MKGAKRNVSPPPFFFFSTFPPFLTAVNCVHFDPASFDALVELFFACKPHRNPRPLGQFLGVKMYRAVSVDYHQLLAGNILGEYIYFGGYHRS